MAPVIKYTDVHFLSVGRFDAGRFPVVMPYLVSICDATLRRATAMKLGTIFDTWIRGELVGTDEFGNRYYRSNQRTRWGREKRWCLFKGSDEPSKVPPEWHAWLHHTVDDPLTHLSTEMHTWQREHEPNMTGTGEAYRPAGHSSRDSARARATGDYEAWFPE
mgnify:FL=1